MKALLSALAVCLIALPAHAKYSGGAGEPNDPYQIATAEDLMLLGDSPEDYSKHFILTADIDLAPNLPGRKVFDKAVIAPDVNDATSVYEGTAFTGVFDGNGQTISHLTITGKDYLGLFGQLASPAQVRELGAVGVNILGSGYSVGGLVGSNGTSPNRGGVLTRCYSTGVVGGSEYVGGLVGQNSGGSVTHCYNTGSVSGEKHVVGGLAGNNDGTLTDCYNTGSVSGEWMVGGLVGSNGGTLTQCYSTGAVRGRMIGGLVGSNNFGEVTNCYSSGSVNGSSMAGGLLGFNIGYVSCCYSAGAVKGINSVGGIVGSAGHVVTASLWDIQTSGQTKSDGGGTGKTTAEMQTVKTFLDAGWDFMDETANGTQDIWWILEGKDYPRLWWELIPEN